MNSADCSAGTAGDCVVICNYACISCKMSQLALSVLW